ncbi:MAG: dihydrofolate reductase [Acidiferrobacterales bacterium]
MGRRTCESLGKNLPARVNTVITRNPSFPAPGSAREDKETFVIGGADLYAQMLPRAQKLYLTLVHAPVRGDVRFPTLNWDEWCEVERTRHCADSRHAYAFSFVTLERKN